MKFRYLSLLVFFTLTTTFLFAQQSKSVLFIGNSYIYSNNMPQLLTDFALANGDTVTYASSTPGGYTLEAHSTDANTLNLIRSQDWDYVILQDQSQRPSFSPGQVSQEVLPYAQALNDSIQANNPCTETVFFMTWGRKYGDQNNCQFYPPICTFLGMNKRLRESYLLMANNNQATVSPVGMAFQHSRALDSTINLWSGDNSHPSLAGSYLAACTFYATLFQKTPNGNTFHSSLSPAVAGHLQNIADSTVMDSFPQWRIGANMPSAAFTHSAANDTVTFSDNSNLATTWSWDFGDGNNSTSQNPVHIYGQAGSYTVTLIISGNCGADTLMDTVVVDQLMALDPGGNGLLIEFEMGPNPSGGQFWVKAMLKERMKIEMDIVDVRGGVVHSDEWEPGTLEFEQEVNVQHLQTGIYFVRFTTAKGIQTYKWVKL